jgi:ABC-type transport system involved in multi-copper enzyme maturation permease subunit
MNRTLWNNVFYHLRNAPVYLLWLVLAAIGITVAALLITWIVAFVAFVIVLAMILWVIGSMTNSLVIKRGDKVIGRVKWFTYTPVENTQ